MSYVPVTWADEIPTTSPIKYKISQASNGDIAANATIEIVTSVTPGTPVNAANLNHLELGVEAATVLAEAASAAVATILGSLYPVGCIYTTTVATNPATIFGFGTWTAFGAGRTLIGVGTSDAVFAAAATGGESNHLLTAAEMPTHTHIQNAHNHIIGEYGKWWENWVSGSGTYGISNNSNFTPSGDTTAVNQNTGGGGAHNNLPPYVVVYFWKRTA